MNQLRTNLAAYINNLLMQDMSFDSKRSILGLYWAFDDGTQNLK